MGTQRRSSARSEVNLADQRGSTRIKARRLVAFRRKRDTGQSDSEGFLRTLDLGLGGLALETDYLFSPDEELTLQILIGESVISVRGQVAYVEPLADSKYRVGVKFIQVGQAELARVEEDIQAEQGES